MAAEQTQPKPKRWLRYSLRSMLLVVLVLSGWLAFRADGPVPPRRPIVGADRMDILIVNLESSQTIANRFAVNQCRKLGPEAIEALPALKELRVRRSRDTAFVAQIDAAIAAVEGGGKNVATP